MLGGPGLGLFWGTALAACLFGANVVALPILRRARLGGGVGRRAARLYMAVGIVTLLVGSAIGLSWAFLFPMAQLADQLAIDVEVAHDRPAPLRGSFRLSAAAIQPASAMWSAAASNATR